MSNFQDNIDKCKLIDRFVDLLSKGNIYNLEYQQQEYILDNNINANYLLSFEAWNDKGARILKGSKAIRFPNNILVFDVNQTNYSMSLDEEFTRLLFDIDISDDSSILEELFDIVASNTISDYLYDDYKDIVLGVLFKRFNNIKYTSDLKLNNPELIDLETISTITNKLFNHIKKLYNEVRFTAGESISLNSLLNTLIDNKGEIYVTRNNNNNEEKTRLAQGISAREISEDERQWNIVSTPEGYRGSLHRPLGFTQENDDEKLRQGTSDTVQPAAIHSTSGDTLSIQHDSKGDGSSGSSILSDRGLDQNDKNDGNIVFLNQQLSFADDLFGNIQSINEDEINNQIIADKTDDIEQNIQEAYENASERFTSQTHVIGTNYINNLQNGISNIPIQNKIFDELNDEELALVESDDELYLAVYNNTVDKGFVITEEMRQFMDSHPYGSQDGIKNPQDIKVLAKWFSPIGAGTWIATEFDGFDSSGNPYLYGCANLGYGWEWGFLPGFDEFKSIQFELSGLRIEKDRSVEVGDSLYDVLSKTDYSAFDDLLLNIPDKTDDEIIDERLSRGSNVENSKYRIYDFYKSNSDSKTITKLLKDEYGYSGSSTPKNANTRYHSMFADPKGISFTLYDSPSSIQQHEIKFSWPEVYKKIKKLIDNNTYLNQDELLEYEVWKNKQDNDDQIEEDSLKQDISDEEESQENQDEAVQIITINDVENYLIQDINIGVGTTLERFNNNIAAIKLLKTLENENRFATKSEQDILAKYVGWGGLSDFFDNLKRPGQFKELTDLLTDEELASARESTLSAFYTQPIIIDTIYKALDKFGFKSGNILEPSCGIGNFFGRIPDNMKDSSLYGVELDSISSRIAKKLYPHANIESKGYEQTHFDDNFFDVAIGNVPFGDFSVMDKRYDKYNFKIHDYFFAKTIDKVKAGGIIAFITSKGTMDKLNSKAREYIAQRCDLIGAVRLPKQAFKAAAGTETVSDIIFLAKRETPRVYAPDWVRSSADNFVNIEYFNRYMSRKELEQIVTDMLLRKDFVAYNQLCKYCEVFKDQLDNYYYFDYIDPTTYEYNEYSSRKAFTREYVIDRWKNVIWQNKYGTIKSNSDYNFYSAGDIELVRWFNDDPDDVIETVALSGKFDSKAKTYEQKIEMAREYLTVSDQAINTIFKEKYVDKVVNCLIDYAKYKDEKQGQYAQAINNYFVDNNEMIIGKQTIETSRFGYDIDVSLDDDVSFIQRLDDCLDNLNYSYTQSTLTTNKTQNSEKTIVLPANMSIKNYSYGIVNDEIYYRTNSTMQLIPKSTTNYEILKEAIILCQKYNDIIKAQLDGVDEQNLSEYQFVLNEQYDSFVEKYGRIAYLAKKLKTFFENDTTLSRLEALEVIDQKTNKFEKKADIFTQRTIHSQVNVIEKCETSFDALLVSLRTRLSVDFELMSKLTDKTKDELINDLKGAIFKNHLNEDEYISADEYLSGNVKQKYKEVSEMFDETSRRLNRTNDDYETANLLKKLKWLEENRNALQDSLPIDLQPYEIDMPLGATWIPEEIIQRFAEDVILEGNFYRWSRPKVLRSDISKNWYIENKTKIYNSSNLTEKYGLNVKGHNALDILESCLNLKREEVAFYVEGEDGKKIRIVDKQKTLIAIQKQDLIKREFANWLKNNEEISNLLAKIYNDKFNCIVERKYNPDLIEPVGLSKYINGNEIQLYSHQKEAIAKALYGGNTGIFHSVGAGKTLTLITIVMESKRLGLCNKSLFVVPKSIVGQWGRDFKAAYPNTNVLVADEKSFTKENRRRFINKISSGNYDAIIISNEQFKLLKLSEERVASYINEDIEKIQSFLAEQKYAGRKDWSIKQAEAIKKKLEARIKKRNEMAKDDFINFEELGIDKLFIDESHNFKNLAFETSLSRVKGIGSAADAQKSNDLYYKTRYLNQLTNNKGIVFASGTPISNYLAEMFTIQRYLQPDTLAYMGVENFDSWVSVFGEIVEEQQLDVTGTKYVPKAVLKRYHNLPELMAAFRQVADIRTKETLDLKLPYVERVNIQVPRTDKQKEYLDIINERLDNVRNNQVDPSEDNMLLITNDGRKMALDQRLVEMNVSEDEKVKVDYVVDNVYNEYIASKDIKGTQAIFSDLSTPSDKWNIYEEIKKQLVEKGIPENEIQFIHDYEKQKDKEKLFDLINDGAVRIILGSTSKLGTGVNMQERMIALHHIDVPWKPSDIEQREGRAVRQGNSNDKVKIYRYITADTFDAYSWQIIENKATFISQIMTNKNPARACDDLDEVILDAAEIKAIATGNPLVKERMTLENDIKKLNISKQEYLKQLSRLKENISIQIPNDIAFRKDNIARLENDLSKYVRPDIILSDDGKEQYSLDITINNKHFTDYKLAGEELHNMTSTVKWPDDKMSLSFKGKLIGKYQDFDIRIACGENIGDYIYVIGDKWYSTVTKYESPINMTRNLIAQLDMLENKLALQKDQLEKANMNLESSKKLLNEPFEFEQELIDKQTRLQQIIDEMDNNANYTSDNNLEGLTLYDEDGSIIDDNSIQDNNVKYKGKEL